MPLPNTKQELADWILRRLGAPIINVNVADVQLEDCIDEAVQFYQEYHFDGAQRSYRTIQITDEIINGNKRRNRQLNAPMFDVDNLDKYRIGNRVTTYDENQQPVNVWIKFDSEEKELWYTFTEDSEGTYFNYSLSPDVFRRQSDDSDGGFITYDSDQHTVFTYSRFREEQDQFYEANRYNLVNSSFLLDGLVWDNTGIAIYTKQGPGQFAAYNPATDGAYDSEFYFRAPYLDINGVQTQYDSDTHVVFKYDINAAGSWVDSESLLTFRSDSDDAKVTYDSDRHVTVTYVLDNLGDYVAVGGSYILYDSERSGHRSLTRFRKESQQPVRFTRQVRKPTEQFVVPTYDSETNTFKYPPYVGTEVSYVVSGFRRFNNTIVIGDVHSTDSERAIYFYRDSDQEYYEYGKVPFNAFDSEKFFFRRLPDLFLDVNGVIVNYDSDTHVINQYNVLSYDSDPTTLGVPLYVDSDSLSVFRSDSDVSKVLYDSDRHGIITWTSYTNPFDSDRMRRSHSLPAYKAIDSDSVARALGYKPGQYDSDLADTAITAEIAERIIFNRDLDSDVKALVDNRQIIAWVDSDGIKVLYDSDKHLTTVYESDANGDWIFDINTPGMAGGAGGFVYYDSDIDSDGGYNWNGIYRFNRKTIYPTFYKKNTSYPILYYRHKKIPDDTLLKREKVLLGKRYRRTSSSVLISKTFEQMWRKESAVLNEPQLKLDYSKEGQLGLQVPDDVIAVTKVFRVGQQSSVDMYNYEYQMFLNNFDFFYGHAGGGLSNYYTLKMNLEHIDFLLNTQPAIRFNKFKDRLYIDMDWGRTKVGDYLVCEVYEITDPEVWGKMYSDTWLKRYATALVKMQWGSNVRKYQNVELPGGIVLNGQELYDEGKEEAEKLEETLKDHWGEMDSILIG